MCMELPRCWRHIACKMDLRWQIFILMRKRSGLFRMPETEMRGPRQTLRRHDFWCIATEKSISRENRRKLQSREIHTSSVFWFDFCHGVIHLKPEGEKKWRMENSSRGRNCEW